MSSYDRDKIKNRLLFIDALMIIALFCVVMLLFMIGYSNYMSMENGSLVNYLDYNNCTGLFIVISLFCYLKNRLDNKSNKVIEKYLF